MTTKQFTTIKKQPNDGYEYREITSYGPTSTYGKNLSNEEYGNAHTDHIVSDYEDDGFECISAICECHDDLIVMKLRARRKK